MSEADFFFLERERAVDTIEKIIKNNLKLQTLPFISEDTVYDNCSSDPCTFTRLPCINSIMFCIIMILLLSTKKLLLESTEVSTKWHKTCETGCAIISNQSGGEVRHCDLILSVKYKHRVSWKRHFQDDSVMDYTHCPSASM